MCQVVLQEKCLLQNLDIYKTGGCCVSKLDYSINLFSEIPRSKLSEIVYAVKFISLQQNWRFGDQNCCDRQQELCILAVGWNPRVIIYRNAEIVLNFMNKIFLKNPCNQCGFNVGGQERKSMKGHMKV